MRDRDALWRHAVAALAALLLHLIAALALFDKFPRGLPLPPEPIPVELAFEPPKPPEPVEPEPSLPHQPLPERRSGGQLEDVPPGPLPPNAEAQPGGASDKPSPAPPPPPSPALPDAPSEQAKPVPPPLAAPPTQETTIAPPTPPTKPRTSRAPASAEAPAEHEAEPNAPVTLLEPGQGGGDRYLNTIRDDLLAHMVWPPTAEMFGLRGGIATYEIVIDRQGRLLEARLVRSAGLAMLDKAALQTIRLAAPFDPVPDDIPGEKIGISIDLTIAPPR